MQKHLWELPSTFVEASIQDMEDMKALVEVYSLEASTNAFIKAPMEGTSMKAFVEAFMEVMEVSAEVMGAFTESIFTKVFVEATVKASVEGMKDMKTCTQVTSMGASTKA